MNIPTLSMPVIVKPRLAHLLMLVRREIWDHKGFFCEYSHCGLCCVVGDDLTCDH